MFISVGVFSCRLWSYILALNELHTVTLRTDERILTALTPFGSVTRGLVGVYAVQEFPRDIGGEITVVCVESIVGLFF